MKILLFNDINNKKEVKKKLKHKRLKSSRFQNILFVDENRRKINWQSLFFSSLIQQIIGVNEQTSSLSKIIDNVCCLIWKARALFMSENKENS